MAATEYRSGHDLKEGIAAFVEWFKAHPDRLQ